MYSKEELIEAVNNSNSYGDTLSNLGRCRSGTSYICLKNNIEKYKIDISHFGSKKIERTHKGRLTANQILVNDQTRTTRRKSNQLRRALIEVGVEHECTKCGLKDTWQDTPITLEIDHINGDWKNNTKENLRFLCPNCHSQTDSFFNKPTKDSVRCKTKTCKCGKKMLSQSKQCIGCNRTAPKPNQRKVERPTKEILTEEIENNSWVALGKKYGVTDKAVRKWAKQYKII